MECLSCFSGCTAGFGCGGPLTILNSTNGCIDCNTIILKRNGEQVSTMLLYSTSIICYEVILLS